MFSAAKPAYSQAQVLIPAVGAGAAGVVFIGIVTINNIAYKRWKKTDGTIFHTPVYQARPKKPKVVPGQMDIFGGTVTTAEECQKMGGTRWQGDSSLGTKGGKNLGRCYK